MTEGRNIGSEMDSDTNTPCFGRRVCPGSRNNTRRGGCSGCIPCVNQFIATEIERGRRLKNLLANLRLAWPLGSDYNRMKKIAIVSRRVGKSWGRTAVRSAISSSPELRQREEVSNFMRAELHRTFRELEAAIRSDSRSEISPDSEVVTILEQEIIEGEEISQKAGTITEGPVC